MSRFRSRPWLVPGVLAALLCVPAEPWADTYVDPVNGLDTRSGADPAQAVRTLRQGMAIAAGGTTVVALPGTYSPLTNGEIFPLDLNPFVWVVSRDGPATARLQDDGPGVPIGSHLVRLVLPAAANFVFQGFTLDGMDRPDYRSGLYIEDKGARTGASPTIRDNVFERFTGTASLDVDGSGVLVWVEARGSFDITAAPIVERNLFRANDEGLSLYAVSAAGQRNARLAGTARNNMFYGNVYGIVCLTTPSENDPSLHRDRAFVETVLTHNTVYGSEMDGIQLVPFDSFAVNTAKPVIANNIIQTSGYCAIEEFGALGDPQALSGNDLFNAAFALVLDEGTNALTTQAEVDALPEAAGGAANLSCDASFVDVVSGDLHLRGDTPLLDAVPPGDPWAVAGDFDGDARPAGTGLETGADEYVTASVDLLRNIEVATLVPLFPALRAVFPIDADFYGTVASGDPDPDTGVLTRVSSPLVFYKLTDAGRVLRLRADPARDTVVLFF